MTTSARREIPPPGSRPLPGTGRLGMQECGANVRACCTRPRWGGGRAAAAGVWQNLWADTAPAGLLADSKQMRGRLPDICCA